MVGLPYQFHCVHCPLEVLTDVETKELIAAHSLNLSTGLKSLRHETVAFFGTGMIVVELNQKGTVAIVMEK